MRTMVVDSGILLALLDPNDAQHHAATAALERHMADGLRLTVPVTALSQVLVGAYRATPYAVRTVERFVDDLIGDVHAADRTVGRAAARLLADHPTLLLADALLIATGEVLGAQGVLTTNQQLEQVNHRIRVLTGEPGSAG